MRGAVRYKKEADNRRDQIPFWLAISGMVIMLFLLSPIKASSAIRIMLLSLASGSWAGGLLLVVVCRKRRVIASSRRLAVMISATGLILTSVGLLRGHLLNQQVYGPMRELKRCMGNIEAVSKNLRSHVRQSGGIVSDEFAMKWCDQLVSNGGLLTEMLHCPSSKATGLESDYMLNNSVVRKSLDALPAEMVLLFEGKRGWNLTGGVGDVRKDHHCIAGEAQFVVVLINGTVTYWSVQERHTLRWLSE